MCYWHPGDTRKNDRPYDRAQQEQTPPITSPCLELSDLTSLTPHQGMEVAVVAVEVHCHQDQEAWDKAHPSPHMWTANYMAKALTALQETSKRPKSSLPGGTSTGASTIVQ